MATANKTATNAWSQAVTAGSYLTLSLIGNGQLEWAVSAAAAAPTVTGHMISRDDKAGINEALNRDIVGTGYLYVRTTTQNETLKYAVTTWS
jgi:hypothetical protein